MDGLDIYIDDYSKPSPLSKLEMAKMVGAQFLKLVDDPKAPKPPVNASAQPAAQPLAAPAETEASAQPPEVADAVDTTTTAEPTSVAGCTTLPSRFISS
jgi:hypothetical protein